MKLYMSPGACSLASHIALHEAGIEFDRATVDLKTKRIEGGGDFQKVNPKGYVPALELDDGELLTENVAILDWISQRAPQLTPTTPFARTRQLEMLAFISTEIHKQFGRVFRATSDDEKQQAFEKIDQRFGFLADHLAQRDYLLGPDVSVADAYLYVMLRWSVTSKHAIPEGLQSYFQRMEGRAAVKHALGHEMLGAIAS